MRNGSIAIIVNDIWGKTETFIRRHVEDLAPGRTAVVARGSQFESETPFPVLMLDPPRGPAHQLARRVLRKARLLPRDVQRSPVTGGEKRRLTGFLEEHGISVMLGEFLDSSLRFLDVARELGIPFYAHAHGYDVSKTLRDPYWRERYREYNRADGVIVMSELVRRRLVDLGIGDERICVVPYGVDVPAEPLARPERDVVRFVAVGRMTGKKAPLLTLEAFRQVHEIQPNVRFDFLGDGELSSAAEAFVRDHGLSGKVILHGHQPPPVVKSAMAGADVFVQHSVIDPASGDEEGLPVAILEAMAQAMPIVSTRHAGIPEAVIEGTTGFLVDEGDTRGMAQRMLEVVRDPAMRRSMGLAGWARANERYTWRRECEELRRILFAGGTAGRNGLASH